MMRRAFRVSDGKKFLNTM